ncbi:hypothetical protein SAMN05443549_11234 [Flavobacterium fluvii]|uniref:Uncharacterized protein n=1 Tax=Flavobacterium fluvii TaxID=468056 RepID=A0A1M5PQD0_9FLAO|nr:hypothetical protein [Flavobacterium fluvii]SHH03958.1 hypothetical protein SAMN05443549_11234 [Flavobacterium fluvii]
MNKPAKYREQLLYFLENEENYQEMLDWIEELPELDQPDVLRLLATLLKERGENTGEKDWIEISNQIAENIDQYEEEILDKKLDKELFIMQFEGVEFELEKIELFLIETREEIIKKMGSNPETYKEMRKLAKLAINTEKSFGIYDPSNWIEIL